MEAGVAKTSRRRRDLQETLRRQIIPDTEERALKLTDGEQPRVSGERCGRKKKKKRKGGL